MMRTKKWWMAGTVVLALALMAGVTPVRGQAEKTAGTAAKENEWKPEDFVMYESAGGFQISPDGKWAVWVKTTADKEKDGRVSNLMLSSLTGKKEIQLTRGTDRNVSPKWSPNGELISFFSTKARPKPNADAAGTQLWFISLAGGEPWGVTEFARGMRGYKWIDNDTIVFSAQEDATLYEREVKKKKDASRVVDDTAHEPPVRLFKLAVKEKKVTRLTENDDWIQSWDVTRDGKKAVTVHGRQPQLSVGMTLDELADLMVELGCTTAMNSDGGGSSVMAVRAENADGAVNPPLQIVNSPSDGQERGRGNAWIVIRK